MQHSLPGHAVATKHQLGIDAIACPTCGYNLTGLREARCPECGSQFTLDQLYAAATKAKGDLGDR